MHVWDFTWALQLFCPGEAKVKYFLPPKKYGSNQTVFFYHFLSCMDSTLKQKYAGICGASYLFVLCNIKKKLNNTLSRMVALYFLLESPKQSDRFRDKTGQIRHSGSCSVPVRKKPLKGLKVKILQHIRDCNAGVAVGFPLFLEKKKERKHGIFEHVWRCNDDTLVSRKWCWCIAVNLCLQEQKSFNFNSCLVTFKIILFTKSAELK